MTRIGFLACETTLPGSPDRCGSERRGDAYEHDLTIAALEPAFAARGLALEVIDWEAPIERFAGLGAVLLGTAWNYQDKPEAFLARLEALDAMGIAVCNPPETVRWNIAKTYLKVLADAGAATIPTLWSDRLDAASARAAFTAFDCERLVVKQQVGAGALGQELLEAGALADDWRFDRPAMVQPFLPGIATEGELSFIFIDGEASHAVRKLPAKGDYRIQSLYGGREEMHEPGADELDAARAVMAALPLVTPLYARIDMLRMANGSLAVMEAELIEPYLYPEQGPELGDRLARGIAKRCKT
ncbi:RimK family alpha-L-glutamate ligase [Qipengyuania nanhaisediminis]|uniref:ATP-grasp domain-containing protein n=1 Tax=Qipengyuania nanhaisediminis TaxID=604088 RepID=UPI0038B2EAA8